MSNLERRKTIVGMDHRWLPAVETVGHLPTEDLREGDMCFVNDEGRSYAYLRGEWVPKSAKPK